MIVDIHTSQYLSPVPLDVDSILIICLSQNVSKSTTVLSLFLSISASNKKIEKKKDKGQFIVILFVTNHHY